jgi:hypothetical protein
MDVYCEQFCCNVFLVCKFGAMVINYLKEKKIQAHGATIITNVVSLEFQSCSYTSIEWCIGHFLGSEC